MCNFLSALYTASGKLICQPEFTDSHSELMEVHKIAERNTAAPVQQFVRLELVPPAGADEQQYFDFSKWDERVDEHEVPEWFDKAARFDAFESMRAILMGAKDRGESSGLRFGGLVFVSKSQLRAVGSRVTAWSGSNVTAESGSNVTAESGSNVTARLGSRVTARLGSNVTAESGSNVTAESGSRVTAWSGSRVTAWLGSNVTAESGSRVTAWSGSNVTAWLGSNVTARLGSNVTALTY